ncbi:alpha-N-arabinofuranosidase [Amphibacillus marinus]|uniref:Alpha-N-arabinofuranosidase n=1 Tax=Amphibacillus marinus TaxID=872970 RepID=A0A1H8QFC5_9BACI|nr:glycoside hydrolase family 43 protein [Amphibacillus marinus]SEO52483.1 alpha-N-arabinofuranosidase [Amphibacillus marinus]
MKFKNPVLSGFYPDPSICRVDDDFYLVTSTFNYFPGMPIFHSRDLVNWDQIGHCLTTEEQLPLERAGNAAGIYAPTIRYYDGTFYVVTTNVSGKQNFIVTATDPKGPWSNPIWLTEWQGIDPSLFFDHQGDAYITGTRSYAANEPVGIYQAKIDVKTGKLLSGRQRIWESTGGSDPEAPHLYYINSKYYLMIAEGGTEYGHMETIARSDHPFGPFEACPHNPILTHRSLNHTIHATGHADLVQLQDGSWWGVCLGIRPIGYPRKHHLGRETFLAPVSWVDGWPVFGEKGRIEEEMEGPALFSGYKSKPSKHYTFNGTKLDLDFNFLRNPDETTWSLNDQEDSLTLFGAATTLNEHDSPAFIARRQAHHTCTIETLLDFTATTNNEEAGLAIYMNNKFHYELVKTNDNGSPVIALRKSIADVSVIAQTKTINSDQVILGVKADPYQYTLYAKEIDSKGTIVDEFELGTAECGMLSTEVAGGFTGVYIGMYASGNGKASTVPAQFKWLDYKV